MYNRNKPVSERVQQMQIKARKMTVRGYSKKEIAEVLGVSSSRVSELTNYNKKIDHRFKPIKPETLKLKQQVIELKAQGLTHKQVAEIIGRSASRVSELIKL